MQARICSASELASGPGLRCALEELLVPRIFAQGVLSGRIEHLKEDVLRREDSGEFGHIRQPRIASHGLTCDEDRRHYDRPYDLFSPRRDRTEDQATEPIRVHAADCRERPVSVFEAVEQ